MNVCLYHANCFDGFAAAWAVWMKHPDWKFIAVNYAAPPPSLEEMTQALPGGKSSPIQIPAPVDMSDGPVFVDELDQLVIVDFSYPPGVLRQLATNAERVIVIDHHKTAAAALEDFHHTGVEVIFDMNHSGARLAWDFFHPGKDVPYLIDYIEDRDLWNWKMARSREINAWVRTHDFNFHEFNWMVGQLQHPAGYAAAATAGEAVLRSDEQTIRAVCANVRLMTIDGYPAIPVVNYAGLLESEIGTRLAARDSAVGPPAFAVVWSIGGNGRVRHSLRSTDAGEDVSDIARRWGGGGHRNAAGAITKRSASPVLAALGLMRVVDPDDPRG